MSGLGGMSGMGSLAGMLPFMSLIDGREAGARSAAFHAGFGGSNMGKCVGLSK